MARPRRYVISTALIAAAASLAVVALPCRSHARPDSGADGKAPPSGAAAGGTEPKGPPAWRKLRPDAPEEPKAEPYKFAYPPMPEGWTPPTLEELEKLTWKDRPVLDVMDVGRKRTEAIKPLCSVEEALKLKNDSPENNAKIVSALCQYPKSDDEVDWDATFNRHDSAPNTLNPLLASSSYDFKMNAPHGYGFLQFDHELKPFGDVEVVKRWRYTDTIDRIDLRDDLTWEDGTPATAYDIEFSYHAICDPRVPATAQRSDVDDIKWVKAYGPNTVVFFHKGALVTNVWHPGIAVIPKHIYERSLTDDPTMRSSQWHAYWNRNPLSGNAYRLKEWVTGQHVLFERRESWYMHDGKLVRRKPYMKTMRFRLIEDTNAAMLALKKGETDEMLLTSRQWQMQTTDDDFYNVATKVMGPEWSYSCIVWNLKRPFFADKRVRRALALAFNYDELIKKVLFNLYPQCLGPFHPDSPWGTPDVKPVKQNLDEAERLLDEAGWTDHDGDGVRDKDGVKFEFTLLVPTGGTGDKVAAVFQPSLKDIGIIMNIKMIEWATYAEQTQGHTFDAGVQAWGVGADVDLAKNIWTTKAYMEGRNYGGYSNPRVDELFEKGIKEFDFEKRRKVYQEVNRILYEDQPYLFLTYRQTFWAFSKELRGYNFSPRDPMSYAPGWASIWKPKKK